MGKMAMIQLPKSVMDDAKLGQVELTNTLQITLALLFPLYTQLATRTGTAHHRHLAS